MSFKEERTASVLLFGALSQSSHAHSENYEAAGVTLTVAIF